MGTGLMLDISARTRGDFIAASGTRAGIENIRDMNEPTFIAGCHSG